MTTNDEPTDDDHYVVDPNHMVIDSASSHCGPICESTFPKKHPTGNYIRNGVQTFND
jgi:hypothetical protein